MPWSSKARILAFEEGSQKRVESFHYPLLPPRQ